MMLGIQRGAGNQAATMAARALLARQAAAPAPAPAVSPPAAAPDLAAELKKAEEFVKGGPYKSDVTPGGAGTEGGFEASYEATKGEITVAMRCAVTFKNAIDDSLTPADPVLRRW